MSEHTKTDPACILHKETGQFRRYLNEHGRGRSCHVCVPPLRRNQMIPAEAVRSKSLLELLGEGRVREMRRHYAARYGQPSLIERILTKLARK